MSSLYFHDDWRPCPDCGGTHIHTCAGLPPDLRLVRTEPGRTDRVTRPLAASRAPRASQVKVKSLTGAILLDADGEAFERGDYSLWRKTHTAIETALSIQQPPPAA